MSGDREDFLARWSRRKREGAEDTATPPAPPAAPAESAREAGDDGKPRETSPARSTAPGQPEPPFDLARLPPIESITAATDIRAFLAPGVPPELTRAALRRVWLADPAIRDFVGLAENAWDFTAPDAVAGFGPLEMTDELRRQVLRMFGDLDPEAADRPDPNAAVASENPSSAETSSKLAATNTKRPTREGAGQVGTSQDELVNTAHEPRSRDELTRRGKVDIAMQHGSERAEDQRKIVHRSHGRALPE